MNIGPLQPFAVQDLYPYPAFHLQAVSIYEFHNTVIKQDHSLCLVVKLAVFHLNIFFANRSERRNVRVSRFVFLSKKKYRKSHEAWQRKNFFHNSSFVQGL